MAVSGGGDSLALMHLVADWAREHGRRLLILTVDHGLNPESRNWTDFARDAAHSVGAEWRALTWRDEKPVTGLPAAARAARHRLLAETAREVGARVILLGHTADDRAEAEWMRQAGSSVGTPHPWSPSPVWPEGRGVMLLRPLLEESRADLRDWLTRRNIRWLDDPANADPRFARARARATLAGRAVPVTRLTPRTADISPSVDRAGVIKLSRAVSAWPLSAAVVCAGGGSRLPRTDRLEQLTARLRQDTDFISGLCGARIEAAGDAVLITREPGDRRSRPIEKLCLSPGIEQVWDGRFVVSTSQLGWSVAPASGRQATLCLADRAALQALPPAARATHPVLIRDGQDGAVLAAPGVRVRLLVADRIRLALGDASKESEIEPAAHGATGADALS